MEEKLSSVGLPAAGRAGQRDRGERERRTQALLLQTTEADTAERDGGREVVTKPGDDSLKRTKDKLDLRTRPRSSFGPQSSPVPSIWPQADGTSQDAGWRAPESRRAAAPNL